MAIKIFIKGGFVFSLFRLHGVLDKLRSVTTGKICKIESLLKFLLVACDPFLFKVIYAALGRISVSLRGVVHLNCKNIKLNVIWQ